TAELEPQDAAVIEADAERSRIAVEVGGKRLEVTLPAALALAAPAGSTPAAGRPGSRRSRAGKAGGASGAGQRGGDSLVTPMQGTIVKIVAAEGQQVGADDT